MVIFACENVSKSIDVYPYLCENIFGNEGIFLLSRTERCTRMSKGDTEDAKTDSITGSIVYADGVR